MRIREFEPSDASDLYELHRDHRVTIHAGGGKSKDQSRESLTRIIQRTQTTGFGALALEQRECEGVIGWCGVQPMRNVEAYEVIYALRPQHWGQGFATEAATALMREAFKLEATSIDDLHALVYPQNVRSVMVLERLGMRYVRNCYDEYSGRYACLYSVSKQTFTVSLGL